MNSISALLKSTASFHLSYCSTSQQHMALVTLPPHKQVGSRTLRPPADPRPLVSSSCLLCRLIPPSGVEVWEGWAGPRSSYFLGGGGLAAKSCPTLATPWAGACQAPLSLGFSRQEHWGGWPFPSPLAFLLYSYWGKRFTHYLFSRNSGNLSPALSPSTRSSHLIVWSSPKLTGQK